MAKQMKINEDGNGTVIVLLVLALVFEMSNTKGSFINWLTDSVGYASSELYKTINDAGYTVFNGEQSWLQNYLKILCSSNSFADNRIFQLFSRNYQNISDIHRNTSLTGALIYRLKNTLPENEQYARANQELLRWLSNDFNDLGANYNCSTLAEITGRITETLNKFDHLNDTDRLPIKTIVPMCNTISPVMPFNVQTEQRNDRIITIGDAELSVQLSVCGDQCNINLKCFGKSICLPVSYFNNINFHMSRIEFDIDSYFYYTYLSRMSYVNNTVVFWSPKIDEFCCEVRLIITSKKLARIIKEKGIIVFVKKQHASKYGTRNYRLVVVSSEMFEEAMRQSDIDTVVLAYVNEFPDDIRMFIAIPVYGGGLLHSKAQQ